MTAMTEVLLRVQTHSSDKARARLAEFLLTHGIEFTSRHAPETDKKLYRHCYAVHYKLACKDKSLNYTEGFAYDGERFGIFRHAWLLDDSKFSDKDDVPWSQCVVRDKTWRGKNGNGVYVGLPLPLLLVKELHKRAGVIGGVLTATGVPWSQIEKLLLKYKVV